MTFTEGSGVKVALFQRFSILYEFGTLVMAPLNLKRNESTAVLLWRQICYAALGSTGESMFCVYVFGTKSGPKSHPPASTKSCQSPLMLKRWAITCYTLHTHTLQASAQPLKPADLSPPENRTRVTETKAYLPTRKWRQICFTQFSVLLNKAWNPPNQQYQMANQKHER